MSKYILPIAFFIQFCWVQISILSILWRNYKYNENTEPSIAISWILFVILTISCYFSGLFNFFTMLFILFLYAIFQYLLLYLMNLTLKKNRDS